MDINIGNRNIKGLTKDEFINLLFYLKIFKKESIWKGLNQTVTTTYKIELIKLKIKDNCIVSIFKREADNGKKKKEVESAVIFEFKTFTISYRYDNSKDFDFDKYHLSFKMINFLIKKGFKLPFESFKN